MIYPYSVYNLLMAHIAPAQRIKDARLAKGWTQEQLAVYADVTSKTVWTAEKGDDVSLKTLRRIGAALGIDLITTVEAAS